MKRRTFIKNSAITAGMISFIPACGLEGTSHSETDLLLDLHVHTTDEYSIDKILELGKERNVRFGIVEHPAPWAIKDDNVLKTYIQFLRKYPVFIGLQPTYPGWINDMSHTPHEDFILKARKEGIKFAFGSDSRNENIGRLSYCRQIAKKCNLTKEDFYVPVRRA